MGRAQRVSIAETIPASVDPGGMVEWLRQQPAFAAARLQRRAKPQREQDLDRCGQRITTGFAALDRALDGGIRSGITELVGSGGRTSLALGMLAAATRRGEVVAWIDTANALDPLSVQGAGVCLDRFLWIRPAGGNRLKQALKAADLVLDAGGFAMLVVDLGDGADPIVKRKRSTQTRSAWWVRLTRRVEAANAALVTLGETDSFCSDLRLECRRFHGAGFEIRVRVARDRYGAPGNSATVSFTQPVD